MPRRLQRLTRLSMRAAAASLAAMTCEAPSGWRSASEGHRLSARRQDSRGTSRSMDAAASPSKEHAAMASTPAVGDLAPDFTLPGTQPGVADRDYTLSAQRGHPV